MRDEPRMPPTPLDVVLGVARERADRLRFGAALDDATGAPDRARRRRREERTIRGAIGDLTGGRG